MLTDPEKASIRRFAAEIIAQGGHTRLNAVIGEIQSIIAAHNRAAAPIRTAAGGLIPRETAAVQALAAYGPGAAVRVDVLAADLGWNAAHCGRVYSALDAAGYIKRDKRKNIMRMTLLKYLEGAPIPAATRKPPLSTGDPLAAAQIQALALIIAAGAAGTTLTDLAATMKTRPGPLTRTCRILAGKGYITINDGVHIATRTADGVRIERPDPDAAVTIENGVRVTRYKTPRAARGYGDGVTACTALPTGGSRRDFT